MVKFEATKEETILISAIAQRAHYIARNSGIVYDIINISMDVEATHCNGNPLKLAELLEADELNFCHDIFGIAEHLNRDTGTLEDCFSPRYSKEI